MGTGTQETVRKEGKKRIGVRGAKRRIRGRGGGDEALFRSSDSLSA